MNKEDLQRCANDLDDLINGKIKSEFEQFLADDQPPPFYSSPKKEETPQTAKYRQNYLDETTGALGNSLNGGLASTLDHSELHRLSAQLPDRLHHELTSMPAASLFSDLYNGLHSLDRPGQNAPAGGSETATMSTPTTDNRHSLNDSGNSQQPFYQPNSDSCTPATAQQSIMMGKVSLFNGGTLELPSTFDRTNFPDLKQTIYQVNTGQQQPALLNNAGGFEQQQQLNEIYQYAASDQLSKSSTIDSDAAYSTLKLLDTASCNSSLVGGINSLNAADSLIKHCYPPAYTPSNFLTNNANGLRLESETDSGGSYTFSSGNQNKPSLSNLLSNDENDYIQGLKNQLNHSQSPMNQMIQISQLNQLNQLNQQLNQQLSSDCIYQASGNFVRSRTAVDLNSVDGALLNNVNLNSSASPYSFVNLPNSHCLTGDDHLLHPQFSPNSSYLAYQQPSDITVLPSTPIPCSSAKEALIQQQLASSSVVIMSNSLSDLAQQQSGLAGGSVAGAQESGWYKRLSRRLRERYIAKRKIQDSSFGPKKSKLDQLDPGADDKKTGSAIKSPTSSSLALPYQLFFVKRCSLVPCLLIFACALLLFVIGLFTILTCYFRNQQQNLLLNDHHLLLTNSHTQLQQTNSALNKAGLPFSAPPPQQPASSAFDAFNRLLLGLTSVVKGAAVFGGSSGSSSSVSSLPNSLTTGEAASKHAVQSESQIKLKQRQTNFWYKSAIFYEVFPASFQDSNNDGVGDLAGLISRLPYIKELGVTAIRLNSIFAALDYPYQFTNILNHTQIEKQLGEMSDFRRLVQSCHQAGLRLVLDLNPTITSDQHRWAAHFLNYQNKTNDSHNFYVNTSDYVSTLREHSLPQKKNYSP